MSTIELSNDELIKKYESESFGDIIRNLEDELWNSGEVICQIIVNNEFVSEAEEKKIFAMKLDNIHHLKIVSKDLDSLIKENIVSLMEWLPMAQSAALEGSKALASNDREAYRKTMMTLFDGCHWFTESIYLFKGTLNKMGVELHDEPKWKKVEIQYMSVVKELISSFEKQDTVLLADVLEYDLSEIFNNWLELLREQDKILG